MPKLYARVFIHILDSSIAENWQHRHVFEDLLKLADQRGEIDMTVEAIARRTNVPLSVVAEAIVALQKPDPNSRFSDEHGCRLQLLDENRTWGWRIVNFAKYDTFFVTDDVRAYKAKKMADYRARKKASSPHPSNKERPNPIPIPIGVSLQSATCSPTVDYNAGVDSPAGGGGSSASLLDGTGGQTPLDPSVAALAKSVASVLKPAYFSAPTLLDVQNYLVTCFDGAAEYAKPFHEALSRQHWKDNQGAIITNWKAMARAYASKAELSRRQKSKG